jgi:hypothetical protein
MAYLIAASSAKPKAPSGIQSAMISQTAVNVDVSVSVPLCLRLHISKHEYLLLTGVCVFLLT